MSASWGHFDGDVRTRWIGPRLMELLGEFSYVDPDGVRWTARAGEIINGASIPRLFWRVIGSPYTGRYRQATVLHDVYYTRQSHSRSETDRMFYRAMRCAGVGAVKAWIMWSAVRVFGPRFRR